MIGIDLQILLYDDDWMCLLRFVLVVTSYMKIGAALLMSRAFAAVVGLALAAHKLGQLVELAVSGFALALSLLLSFNTIFR